MREIKFRGKRTANGEWVYGGYFKNHQGNSFIVNYISSDLENVGVIPVDPKTVGQYIGIKDDIDKEIHEGDIIRIRESEFDDWEVYQVKYHGHRDYPAFDTEPTIDCDCNGISYATACCNIEKIGNIFDNPELLEVEQCKD